MDLRSKSLGPEVECWLAAHSNSGCTVLLPSAMAKLSREIVGRQALVVDACGAQLEKFVARFARSHLVVVDSPYLASTHQRLPFEASENASNLDYGHTEPPFEGFRTEVVYSSARR